MSEMTDTGIDTGPIRGHIAELGHPGPPDLVMADLLLLCETVDTVRAQRDAAREALIRYGDHEEGCPRRPPVSCVCDCTCGWADVLDPMLPTPDDVTGILAPDPAGIDSGSSNEGTKSIPVTSDPLIEDDHRGWWDA